jgi:hypothetical protein
MERMGVEKSRLPGRPSPSLFKPYVRNVPTRSNFRAATADFQPNIIDKIATIGTS